MTDTEIVAPVAAQFPVEGSLVSAQRYGNGHINDTFVGRYATDSGERRFIHQRINERVFADIPGLMENVGRVTRHVPEITPRLIATIDGDDVLRAEDGSWWRTYAFVEGASSYETVDGTERAYNAARAFGGFARALADLGGARLHESIPGFHDTNRRFAELRDAIARDPLGRVDRVRHEIGYCLANAALADRLEALRRDGIARECVTHNDTKLNNVLMDDRTGKAACVIDLDSVMPGLALYDFGDLVRTATCAVPEDESDPRLVEVDVACFGAVAHGFIDGAGSLLAPAEREHLVTAGRVITFECGMRFLTDFLLGDRYFRIARPGQNLDRAHVQFALVDSLADREVDLLTAL